MIVTNPMKNKLIKVCFKKASYVYKTFFKKYMSFVAQTREKWNNIFSLLCRVFLQVLTNRT